MTKSEFLKNINDGLERGAKQKLSKLLKIDPANVTMWFSGKNIPSENNIKKMSALFSIPEEEIKSIFTNDKSNNSFFQYNTDNANNNSNLTVNENSNNYRLLAIEQGLELLKKEMELFKLQIEKKLAEEHKKKKSK